jgi:signal transduction histidine kinase
MGSGPRPSPLPVAKFSWVDALIASVVLTVGLVEELANPTGHQTSGGWLVGVVVVSLALAVRRKFPVAVLGAVLVVIVLVHNPSGSAEALTAWQFYSLVIAMFAVGLHAPLSRGLPAFAVALAVTAAIAWRASDVADQISVAVPLAVAGAIGVAGRQLQGSRRRLASLASELLSTSTRDADQAVQDERARIARELHDIVAHNVSVIVLQIGSVRHRLPADLNAESEMLSAAESMGRATVEELHSMLGLLRPSDVDARQPSPSLARLGDLIDPVVAAGREVEVTVTGDVRPLSGGLDLSAYRIVQEALTNSIKHAGGARTTIAISYGADVLELLVTDDGQKPSVIRASGHGLLGIRERAAVLRGEVEAGPRPGGGFEVRARLPIPGAPR